jgi:hypothetical protein
MGFANLHEAGKFFLIENFEKGSSKNKNFEHHDLLKIA